MGGQPMKGSTASEAKNNFGQLIDTAMVEPVAIEKRGRRVAVLISYDKSLLSG
jgi:prevent-host-death family protein